MIFSWLRKQRRKRILAQPFPSEWERAIFENMAHYRWLNEREQLRLRRLVQVFIAEKRWEGAGGLVITDEIKATVAAQACLLILALEHDFYRQVESIVIYPSTVLTPARQPSFFANSATIVQAPMPILGQAFTLGPVILAWDAVRSGGQNARDAKNVVYHEFAHKLDMLSGRANGVPPLADRATYNRWVEIFTEAYEDLSARAQASEKLFLDPYALSNGAEFFAVATESFFERPCVMRDGHAAMYAVLRDFYRQDPAARVPSP
jgi:Mlc titration factor MtfA (ptsG expression regulator)